MNLFDLIVKNYQLSFNYSTPRGLGAGKYEQDYKLEVNKKFIELIKILFYDIKFKDNPDNDPFLYLTQIFCRITDDCDSKVNKQILEYYAKVLEDVFLKFFKNYSVDSYISISIDETHRHLFQEDFKKYVPIIEDYIKKIRGITQAPHAPVESGLSVESKGSLDHSLATDDGYVGPVRSLFRTSRRVKLGGSRRHHKILSSVPKAASYSSSLITLFSSPLEPFLDIFRTHFSDFYEELRKYYLDEGQREEKCFKDGDIFYVQKEENCNMSRLPDDVSQRILIRFGIKSPTILSLSDLNKIYFKDAKGQITNDGYNDTLIINHEGHFMALSVRNIKGVLYFTVADPLATPENVSGYTKLVVGKISEMIVGIFPGIECHFSALSISGENQSSYVSLQQRIGFESCAIGSALMAYTLYTLSNEQYIAEYNSKDKITLGDHDVVSTGIFSQYRPIVQEQRVSQIPMLSSTLANEFAQRRSANSKLLNLLQNLFPNHPEIINQTDIFGTLINVIKILEENTEINITNKLLITNTLIRFFNGEKVFYDNVDYGLDELEYNFIRTSYGPFGNILDGLLLYLTTQPHTVEQPKTTLEKGRADRSDSGYFAEVSRPVVHTSTDDRKDVVAPVATRKGRTVGACREISSSLVSTTSSPSSQEQTSLASVKTNRRVPLSPKFLVRESQKSAPAGFKILVLKENLKYYRVNPSEVHPLKNYYLMNITVPETLSIEEFVRNIQDSGIKDAVKDYKIYFSGRSEGASQTTIARPKEKLYSEFMKAMEAEFPGKEVAKSCVMG